MSLLTCPYDPVHQIKEHAMPKHLIKCAKNNPHIKFEICQYNSIHLYPANEIEEHEKNCPQRREVEKQQVPKSNNCTPAKVVVQIAPIVADNEEEWGEIENASYNPQKIIAKKPVIRSNMGKTPSEKKLFRKQERERLEKLQY